MESTDGTVGKLIGTVQTHFGPCGGLHLLLGAVCAAMETLGFVQYMWTSCAGWGVAGATFFILEGLLSLLVACTRPLDKCAMKVRSRSSPLHSTPPVLRPAIECESVVTSRKRSLCRCAS